MKIENEIQQEQFSSDEEKVLINILYSAGWIGLQVSHFLKPFHITMQQYNVLRILRGQKNSPMTILSITERMVDRSSNASRLVEKLRQKNLVRREQNKRDRRSVDVVITAKGMQLLSEIDEQIYDWQKNLITLSSKEIFTLNSLLDKLRT